MNQGRLFRLKIVGVEPVDPDDRGLHCELVGTGDDGRRYYLKKCDCGNHLVPAAEFVCTKLAAACGLTVPVCNVAELPSGELVFASRHLDRARPPAEFLALLLSGHPHKALIPHFSRWLAFDLFTNNYDRSLKNFLLHEKEGGGLSLAGLDFGGALFAQGWPPGQLALGDPTLLIRRGLAGRFPLDARASAKLLDQLASLPDDWMQTCLEELPPEWDRSPTFKNVQAWWPRHRHGRIARIKQDISDGKYV